ncbi:6-cysteine protein [Plasmodium ovale wallikeri]|nr:6-cysteine protein [Plasmodium ovale wallikeri]SBT56969.1 6-cysteine protein [Plasmodium ovale wallikeri]
MKSAGCEFRVGGSLYVTNTFVNNNCTVNVRNMDLTPKNHDDISFSIVVPSKFDISRNCFNSNEMYENNNMSLYYLEEENIEGEDIKIYTFFFYKYIVINTKFKESTCIFESDTSREKLNVYITMDGYYKEYSCDMSYNLCDFFINEQSIIRIHHDDNWDVDEEFHKSKVLYNGIYITLNNILSHSNVYDFVHISHNTVVITIPDIIPSTRTIKIPFYDMGNNNKIKYAYLRLQQNVKSYKKVMGVNFSDTFDIQYEYFKYREDKMKFLLNHFSETNYIGMICQTTKEITTLPCTFSLVNYSNKNIAIHSVFPHKVPFLYHFDKKKKGDKIDSYLSETRFVVYKDFDILLQEKKIKYVLFKCICNAKNGHTENFKEIEYYITNENISKDMMNSPKIIHPSRNIKHSDDPKQMSNINNSRNNPFRNNTSGLSHEDEQHFRKSYCVYSLLNTFLLTVTLAMFFIVSHYL